MPPQPLQLRSRPINASALEQTGLKRYYTPDGSVVIKRSNYGAKETQREQRSLQPAKILNNTGASDTVVEFVESVV